MTFRLPFQILRAVSRSRPSSPNKLFNTTKIQNEFQNFKIASCLDSNNNRKILQNSNPFWLRQNVQTPPHFLPRYSFQRRFKSTNYEQRKNLENRKKVRKLHKCFERKCERKLAFRQTTREECEQCIGTPVPDKCPKLRRVKPAYDDSLLKWKHENCPVDICLETPRMDEVKGLKIVKKKLPKLVDNDCERCLPDKPSKAPKLIRLKKQYDPNKLEQDRDCYKDLCNIDPPRMDDVRGYAVKPKKLPKIPSDCMQCAMYVPTKAPKLVRPKQRYDPNKMEQDRNCPKDLCNIDPPRMDDVVGLKVVCKKLPKIPADDCVKCVNYTPKHMPKLVRPKRKYDPSKMKWQHPPCRDFCDDAAPRMDDVHGVKVVKKKLPKLVVNKCDRCVDPVPKPGPRLARPPKRYDDSKLKWEHEFCPKGACEEHPERMDKILGLKVEKKILPKLKPSTECTYCRDVPTTAPKLVRLKKKYDDSKLKWQHECLPEGCDAHPLRSDVLKGYKVVSKKLRKIPSDGCRLCMDSLCVPTKAPKLTRPKQHYDPYKLEQDRNCYKDLCNIDPPRMDDVVGLKVIHKKLPTLPVNECGPCLFDKPSKAPKLVGPKQKYDPNEMKWQHPPCMDFCDDASPRMDDVVGYKVTPKKLPEIPAPCKRCVNYVPKYAPELHGPKRKYDPSTLEKNHCKLVDLCDLCPPRMDDVRCWKPKKKKLPSFNSTGQCRCFSTLTAAGNRMTYPIYSCKNYTKLREKAYTYGRRYGKKPPDPLKHIPQYTKVCPKFKCPGCKPYPERRCGAVYDRECTKTEAPYGAYSDCMDGWWEDEPTECIDWNQVMLQPQKQVQGHFYKLKPPPPKWCHVDPSLERKCIANKKPDPPPLDETDRWENPCPGFKSCGNRARKHCHVPKDHPQCKKLEAPYKSFSDQCPQFPEIELTECDLADKIFKDMVVDYRGKSMKKPKCEKYCEDKKKPPKGCKPQAFDACKSLPDFMKKREPVKCRIPCNKTKSKTMNVKIDGKKYKCKTVDVKESKCGGSKEKIQTMVCAAKDCEKIVVACKPVADPCKKSNSKTKSKSSKPSSPSKGDGSKTVICASKNSKKMVCVCKPISKCGSKESCPPKKVSSCPKKPSKSKCKKSSNTSCGKISGMKMHSASKPPSPCKVPCPCPPPTPPKPAPPPPSPSLWDKICAYFRARPGCPGPNEWKQKELEDKARKAAAAAGLKVCKPKCKCVKVDKKKLCCQMMGTKCKKPKKTSCCSTPKKDPCAQKSKKSSCGPKLKKDSSTPKRKKSSCCSTPKNDSCAPESKKSSCCSTTNVDPCAPESSSCSPKTNWEIPGCPKPKPKKKPCCSIPKEDPCSKKKKKSSGSSKPRKDPPCCPKQKPKKKSCCSKRKPKKVPCDRSPTKECKKSSEPKKTALHAKLPDAVRLPASGQQKIEDPKKCSSTYTDNAPKSSNPVNKPGKQNPSKLIDPAGNTPKKNYATFVARNRYFSTYSRVNNDIKKKNKRILTNRKHTDSKSLKYSDRSTISNVSHSYLRLNNNYMGKIYKLKLTKIGIRNALIPRNPDDDPFTVCHLCKVIPRHETMCKEKNPDMKNLKVKLKSEQRKALN